MRELDHMAIEAAADEQVMNRLIAQHEFFILKCASSVARRYITKSDDEWSLALLAFTQAVQSYVLQKGSFLKFAELVIRRRLIDYFRMQSKYSAEISVNPSVFQTEMGENEEDISVRMAVAQQVSQTHGDALRMEIAAANEMFSLYGFSFFDLADCSPKAAKTKSACAKATAFLLRSPMLIHEIRGAKQLPLKIIVKNTKVSRKILERHRKYIIAAVEILSGEYPYLAEYMRFIREELDQ